MVVHYRQMCLVKQTQPKCSSMWFVAGAHFRSNHHQPLLNNVISPREYK